MHSLKCAARFIAGSRATHLNECTFPRCDMQRRKVRQLKCVARRRFIAGSGTRALQKRLVDMLWSPLFLITPPQHSRVSVLV